MRILVISNFYPPAHVGGYELECARVVDHLREQHELRVLSSHYRRGQVGAEEGVLRELPFERFRKRDSLRAPLWALRAARLMRRTLESFRPDLIFVWNGAGIPQAAIRVAELSGRPVAYRICEHWFGQMYRADTFLRHFYPGDTGLRRVWGALMGLVNRHPSLQLELSTAVPVTVAWVSEALREMTGVPPTVEPLLERTVYTGVEVPTEVPRSLRPRPTIGFVGRLTPEKAPDVALRALAALRERHGVDAALVVAGDAEPSYEESLRRLSRDLGVEDHVDFVGRLERTAALDLMSELHAVVVPSRWQEPSGTVASEAAAVGTPVVAARSGGMPEILREDEHALYFDIDDVEQCALALAEVLGNPARTAERSGRARARAADVSLEAEFKALAGFVSDSVRVHSEASALAKP